MAETLPVGTRRMPQASPGSDGPALLNLSFNDVRTSPFSNLDLIDLVGALMALDENGAVKQKTL
jgi:hypothetical protein